MVQKKRYSIYECEECIRPVKDENGKVTANCTKALHISKKKPRGNCKKVMIHHQEPEFDRYQDAQGYYDENFKDFPWPWSAFTDPVPIGTNISAICDGCSGGNATVSRRN